MQLSGGRLHERARAAVAVAAVCCGNEAVTAARQPFLKELGDGVAQSHVRDERSRLEALQFMCVRVCEINNDKIRKN